MPNEHAAWIDPVQRALVLLEGREYTIRLPRTRPTVNLRSVNSAIRAIRTVLPRGERRFTLADSSDRRVGDVEVAELSPFTTAAPGWTSLMPDWPYQYRTVEYVRPEFPHPVIYVR